MRETRTPARGSAILTLIALFAFVAAPGVLAQSPPSHDTMVVAVPALPTELDPDFAESAVKGNVLRQVLDLPTWYDHRGVLHGWVFDSWEVIDDGLTWRFAIREGLEFHSGTPVNAETVKFTFDRMLDEELLARGADNQFPHRVGLVSVDVIDEYVLDITTDEPNSLVTARLYVVYLVDPAFYADATPSEAATMARGGGPYEIVAFVPDDYVEFVRNDDYWNGAPDIERIVVRAVPERSSRIAMLETGEVDIALDLGPDDIPILLSIPGVNVAATESSRRIGLAFNQREERFQDKRVRQAFNYAIDFDEINEALLYGMASRLQTYRGTDVCSDPDMEPYPYDPERALALLEEANFPMDEEVVIHVGGHQGYRIQVVQAMASQLQRLGINARTNVVEASVFTQMVGNRDFTGLAELGLGGRGVPAQDATVFAFGGFWNPTGWEDEAAHEFNELLGEIQAEFDPDVVCEMTKVLEAIAYEHAPWLYSHHPLEIAGVNERIDWAPRIDAQLFWWTANWAR